MVDKLAGDVQDSSAPQAGIKQILHNTVYDAIYNLGAVSYTHLDVYKRQVVYWTGKNKK